MILNIFSACFVGVLCGYGRLRIHHGRHDDSGDQRVWHRHGAHQNGWRSVTDPILAVSFDSKAPYGITRRNSTVVGCDGGSHRLLGFFFGPFGQLYLRSGLIYLFLLLILGFVLGFVIHNVIVFLAVVGLSSAAIMYFRVKSWFQPTAFKYPEGLWGKGSPVNSKYQFILSRTNIPKFFLTFNFP